jgi:probable HAF family extracellular repeat protein
MDRTIFSACGLAIALLVGSSAAAAQDYQFQMLPDLAGLGAGASGINNVGDIVGGSEAANHVGHAVLWRQGLIIDLGTADALRSSNAVAINARGQVIGDTDTEALAWNAHGRLHSVGEGQVLGLNATGVAVGFNIHTVATVWIHGIAQQLPMLPGGYGSEADAINDQGDSVGCTELDNRVFPCVATVWRHSRPVQLPDLGGEATAHAINNVGQIAGLGWDSNNHQHALRWDQGRMVVLDSPYNAYALGINNLGQVVGDAFIDPGQPPVAALWNGTTFTDLNTYLPADLKAAGWKLQEARAINDAGWIVGSMVNQFSLPHGAAFLLVPGPPAAAAATRALPE